jgi:hypothetical protein
MNPIDDPELYEYVVLEGQRSPGLAIVAGAANTAEWEKVKGKGSDWGSLKYNGEGLAEFTVDFRAWEPEHFVEWESFGLRFKRPASGTEPKAKDIAHPWLDELEIGSVVVGVLPQWTALGGGLFSRVVKFIQYRAPKPAAAGKATGSSSVNGSKSGTGANGATAKDAYDQTIEDLTKQVQDLSKEPPP